MKSILSTILIISFFIGGIYLVYSEITKVKEIEENKHVLGENYVIESPDGGEIDLRDYIGKQKVILEFVADPCACCASTIPMLKKFDKSQDDIKIITIGFSGIKDTMIKRFTEDYKIDYTWGIDLDRNLSDVFGVKSSPTFVFFDEEGNHLETFPYVIGTEETLIQNYESYYNKFHSKESGE